LKKTKPNQVLATPLELVALWFAVSFAIRMSKSLIDRFIHSWQVNSFLSLGETQRITLRTASIAGALKGLVSFILVIAGIIWTLGLLTFQLAQFWQGEL
jgi:small conductance mechanosensitive channel